MKRVLLSILLCCPLYSCLDSDQFSAIELLKIEQSHHSGRTIPIVPISSKSMFLPVMSVSFDIMISDETIMYETPLFLLDGVPVICQICQGPPYQIEVTKGKLKCFCFQHMPKRRRSNDL